MAQLVVELFRSDPPHILDPHQTAGDIIKVPILVRVPLVVLVDAKGTLDRETGDVPREVMKPRSLPSKGRLVKVRRLLCEQPRLFRSICQGYEWHGIAVILDRVAEVVVRGRVVGMLDRVDRPFSLENALTAIREERHPEDCEAGHDSKARQG